MNESIEYCGMTIKSVFVSPELALEWLERLNAKNRTMRRRNVEALKGDMRSERYYPNPTAMICFDAEGFLVNGQHTLEAILESERGYTLLVAKNVPAATVGVMDTGAVRTFTDASHFLSDGESIESRGCAIVRALVNISSTAKMSYPAIIAAYLKHQDAVDFVLRTVRRKRGQRAPAPFLAVIARAWYQEQHRARLVEFIDVIETGLPKGMTGDQAAIRLRDFLVSHRGGGEAVRMEILRKTTNALWHFINRQPMSRLDGTSANYFPLPEEDEEAVKAA